MRRLLIALFVALMPALAPAQGSWSPAGADPSFPRTLLDSLAVPGIRSTLSDPDHLSLYGSIWSHSFAAIPAGNATDADRVERSMLAREAAFVILMDRKYDAGAIVPLPAPDRDTLQARVIRLLEGMNTTVETGGYLTFYTPWQGRSKEIINYLIAYDLMKGAGIQQALLEASKTKLLTFTANLYQKAMASYTFMNLKFFTYQFNNHSIMSASALGLAAIVFNDYGNANVNYQPLNWINAGLYNIDNTLWMENGSYPRVSEPDTLAGYAEGPNYFKYCFENAFPFIRAMGGFLPDGNYSATFNSITRSIRNPWYDPRYDRLYDWLNKIRMPDGGFPSIHDSYMGYGTVIMALSGKPQYNLPNPGFNADEPWIRSQYIATNVAHGIITDSLFQALPGAGSLVFRSSWQTSAVFMHFIGKHGIALTGAKSHHQGDASSFSLMAYGELLAVDPGYPGASQADLENKAIDHSLVLVNNAGPLPPTGELVSTSTNTAYIERYFDTPLLDYGEVRTAYQGADVIRRNLFVRNGYFLLADQMSSASAKNYTFQLHGNGLYGALPAAATGAFVPDFSNGRGLYQRNGVTLLAAVGVTGGMSLFAWETDSMVINGGFRRYSKMLAAKNSVAAATFLSALVPYTSPAPVVNAASQGSASVSFRVLQNGFHDLAFCSQSGAMVALNADSTGMNKAVKGDGKLNFYSETSTGGFSSAFMGDGDSLVAGGRQILRATGRIDMAWMRLDSTVWAGYVSAADTVRVCADGPMQVLTGSVTALAYDSVRHQAKLFCTAKGNFLAAPASLTWVWTGQAGTSWHDAANWQLEGHPQLHGVPVAANSVYIPAGSVSMPVVSSAAPAVCRNLTIVDGAALTVASLRFLTVEGTLTLGSAK